MRPCKEKLANGCIANARTLPLTAHFQTALPHSDAAFFAVKKKIVQRQYETLIFFFFALMASCYPKNDLNQMTSTGMLK
jgi:hypothetical protein